VLTAAGLSSSGSLTAGGSVVLGGNSLMTVARAVYSTPNKGRTTYVYGQASGDV